MKEIFLEIIIIFLKYIIISYKLYKLYKMSRSFDFVVKAEKVVIKKQGHHKYKVKLDGIRDFLKYQVWSKNNINGDRGVSLVSAKDWVQNNFNSSVNFAPTAVMDVDNTKYIFVIENASYNKNKNYTIFDISTNEIIKNKISKPLVKLPINEKLHNVRFDIDSNTYNNNNTIDLTSIAKQSNENSNIWNMDGDQTISSTDTLIIKETQTLLTGSYTLTNNGTINNSGTINNNFAITNNGYVTNNSSGTINNNGVSNNTNITFTNSGTLTNNGTITFNNSANVSNSGTIINNSKFTMNTSYITNVRGNITNNNNSTLTMNAASVIYNNSTVTNSGTITIVSSTISNQSYGNPAIINNNSGGVININSGGAIGNYSYSIINNNTGGTINNNSDGTVDSGINNSGGTINNNNGGIITNLSGSNYNNKGKYNGDPPRQINQQ